MLASFSSIVARNGFWVDTYSYGTRISTMSPIARYLGYLKVQLNFLKHVLNWKPMRGSPQSPRVRGRDWRRERAGPLVFATTVSFKLAP